MSGRKRYIAVGNKWVEVSSDYTPTPSNSDALLWNDRAYQDASDPRFVSRSAHREYMRQNNLTTYDDFKNTFAQAQKTRDEFRTTGKDPSRASAVAEAFHNHNRRK